MDMQTDIFGGETEYAPTSSRPTPVAPAGPAEVQGELFHVTKPKPTRGIRAIAYSEPTLAGDLFGGAE